jgi:hypothetical protein
MKTLLKNVLLACGLSAALPVAADPAPAFGPSSFGPFIFNGSSYTIEVGDTDIYGIGTGKDWSTWTTVAPIPGDARYLANITSYDEYMFVRGIVQTFFNAYSSNYSPLRVIPYFAFGNGTYPADFVMPLPATSPNNIFNPWIGGTAGANANLYGAFFSADCSIPPATSPSSACGLNDPSWLVALDANLMTYAIFEEDIPVPATMALIGLGLVGLGLSSRRRA